jgi:hypothetical protein
MPPRGRSAAAPPAPSTPLQGLSAQLNPQQLAALQEHIRQMRIQTGGEVTAQMVSDWMIAHRGQGQGGQQMDQQQMAMQQQQQRQQQQQQLQQQQQQQLQQQQLQQQQLQQQQQPQYQQQQHQQQPSQQQANLDQVIAHLFPPHLAGNQAAGLSHLQSILFPTSATGQVGQSPLLQQVMLLAANQRLTPEQMAQLKVAVALKNSTNGASRPISERETTIWRPSRR